MNAIDTPMSIRKMALSNENLTELELWFIDQKDEDIRTVGMKLISELRTLRQDNEKLKRDLAWEQNPVRLKNQVSRQMHFGLLRRIG